MSMTVKEHLEAAKVLYDKYRNRPLREVVSAVQTDSLSALGALSALREELPGEFSSIEAFERSRSFSRRQVFMMLDRAIIRTRNK